MALCSGMFRLRRCKHSSQQESCRATENRPERAALLLHRGPLNAGQPVVCAEAAACVECTVLRKADALKLSWHGLTSRSRSGAAVLLDDCSPEARTRPVMLLAISAS